MILIMKIKLLFLANIFTGGKLEFFPGINAFLNYHCVFGFQINYIYSLLDEKIKKFIQYFIGLKMILSIFLIVLVFLN